MGHLLLLLRLYLLAPADVARPFGPRPVVRSPVPATPIVLPNGAALLSEAILSFTFLVLAHVGRRVVSEWFLRYCGHVSHPT